MNIRLDPSDFHWWRTAPEETQSSRSTIGFSHYIAQSHSKTLTAFQIQKLNVVSRIGRPLLRWLNGILCLLEKEPGNIDIEKIRYIILFEADLNWWMKMLFARG